MCRESLAYPVNGAQEGDDHRAVADLDWLKLVEVMGCLLVADQDVVQELGL